MGYVAYDLIYWLWSCITYECMDIGMKCFMYMNCVSGLCLGLRDTALNINLPCVDG